MINFTKEELEAIITLVRSNYIYIAGEDDSDLKEEKIMKSILDKYDHYKLKFKLIK